MKPLVKNFFQKRIKRFVLSLTLVLSVICCSSQTSHQLTIVTFGNSTTAPRKTVKKVYAVRLHEILKNAGIDNKVINAGIPGSHTGSIKDNNLFKIPHGMDRFDTAVLRYHPDWVTINFGINDSWQDAGKKGTSRIPINKYRQNLSFFIEGIRKEGGKVILLTPNPIGKKYRGFHRSKLKKYMKITRKLARNKNLPFIDTWKLFSDYVRQSKTVVDSLLLDGTHPNDTGHELIANAIAKKIISSSK